MGSANGDRLVLRDEAPSMLTPPQRGFRLYRAADGSFWCLHPDGRQHMLHTAEEMKAMGDG